MSQNETIVTNFPTGDTTPSTTPSPALKTGQTTIKELMDEKRYGIFSLQSNIESLDIKFIGFIMSHFFITRTEHIQMTGEYIYHAVSSLFEKVESDPMMVPVYILNVKKEPNGSLILVVENATKKMQEARQAQPTA